MPWTWLYNLLTEGGHFLQFDKFQFDGFGNTMLMEQYVMCKGMRIILIAATDAYDKESGLAMMLWKKVPPGYNRIAELERMANSGEIQKMLSWKPEMPLKERS